MPEYIPYDGSVRLFRVESLGVDMKVCCGGDTLCVVEHVSSVLLVKLGKSIRHCVPFVGVFYKLFLSSLMGILFLAGSLCLFHWTKSGP